MKRFFCLLLAMAILCAGCSSTVPSWESASSQKPESLSESSSEIRAEDSSKTVAISGNSETNTVESTPPDERIPVDSEAFKKISDEIYRLEQSGLLWINWDSPNDIPVNFLTEYFNFSCLYHAENDSFNEFRSTAGYFHIPDKTLYSFLALHFSGLDFARLEAADRFDNGEYHYGPAGQLTTPDATSGKFDISCVDNQYTVSFHNIGYEPNPFNVKLLFIKEGTSFLAYSNHITRNSEAEKVQPIPLKLPITYGVEAVCLVRDYLNRYDYFPVPLSRPFGITFHKNDLLIAQTDELFDTAGNRTAYIVSLCSSPWVGNVTSDHEYDTYTYSIESITPKKALESYQVQLATGAITKLSETKK